MKGTSVKLLIGLLLLISVISIISGCNNIISVINKSPNGTYTATSGQTLVGTATSAVTFHGDTLTIISSNPITGQMRGDYEYDFITREEIVTEYNIERYSVKTSEQLRILYEKREAATTQSAKKAISSDMSALSVQRQATLGKMRTMLRQLVITRSIDPEATAYIILSHTLAENASLIGLTNIITKEVEIHSFKYLKEQDIVIIDEIPFYK